MRMAIAGALLIAGASGAAATDRLGAAETHMERARNGMNACSEREPDQLSVGKCYSRIAQRLALQTKRALEDRSESARSRELLKSSTGSWSRTMAIDCDQIAKLEFEGGSGQGLHMQTCEINLLAARLDVMRVSPDKY